MKCITAILIVSKDKLHLHLLNIQFNIKTQQVGSVCVAIHFKILHHKCCKINDQLHWNVRYILIGYEIYNMITLRS